MIFSRSRNTIILVELNVPWEEVFEEAYERERLRYTDLVDDCKWVESYVLSSGGWSNGLCFKINGKVVERSQPLVGKIKGQ